MIVGKDTKVSVREVKDLIECVRAGQAFSRDLLSPALRRHVFFVSLGLSFDHRLLVKVDARTCKTSLTTVNRND